MDRVAEFAIDDRQDGGRVLALSGPYLISSVAEIEDGIYAVEGPVARIDLSEVSEIDTVGAWIACDLAKEHDAEITGASERAQRLMDAVCGLESDTETSAPREPLRQRIFDSCGAVSMNSGSASPNRAITGEDGGCARRNVPAMARNIPSPSRA
mgnify:CR=1 FL=1